MQLTRVHRRSPSTVSKYPWRDGSFRFAYERRETRDGTKEFVSTSIPCLSHADGIPMGCDPLPPQPTGDGDGDGDGFIGAASAAHLDGVVPQPPPDAPKRFEPPTVEEAARYGRDIGLPDTEVQKWHDHHTARGWKLGRGLTMKDWHAAMRTWQKNYRAGTFAGRGQKPVTSGLDTIRCVNDPPKITQVQSLTPEELFERDRQAKAKAATVPLVDWSKAGEKKAGVA